MSLSAFVLLFDLGVINAIVSPLAGALGRNDHKSARRLVGVGMAVCCAAAVALIVACVLLSKIGILSALVPVAHGLENERDGLILLMVILYATGIPLALFSRIRQAAQQTHVSAAVELVGQIGVLCCIPLLIYGDSVSLAAFVVLGVPLVVAATHACFLFANPPQAFGGSLTSRPRYPDVMTLIRPGFAFMIMQCSGIAVTAVDPLLASHLLDTSAVVDIGIAQRMFLPVVIMASMALAPLWPAYSAANAVGDHAFVRRAFMLSLAAVSAFALISVVILLLIHEWLLLQWLGPRSPRPDFPLLFANATWVALASIGGCGAVLLNGLGFLRFQVCMAISLILVAPFVKIALVQFLGSSGLIWGAIIAQVTCVIIPVFIVIFRISGRGWKS